MDSERFLRLWQLLDIQHVRYLLTGDYAAAFYGSSNFTGIISILIEDLPENRQRLKEALRFYSTVDFDGFMEMDLSNGFLDILLDDLFHLAVYGNLTGVKASFDDCLRSASIAKINGTQIPVLHINHLIANKKAVGRPKDLTDVIYLEKILKLREGEK